MEMQHADPRLRRLAVLSCTALVVVGSFALWAFQGWLARVAQAEPSVAQRQLLAAFACLMGATLVILLALSVFLWRVGARVRAAAQYPPPGMRVLRDTVVLRGAAAHRRAGVIEGIAVALILCTVGLVGVTWRFYSAFAAYAA
jgi:hypothetical protein